jgi:hypothetical protein
VHSAWSRPGRWWPGLVFCVGLAGTPLAAQTLGVPAVPYLSQPEALCGGAALAMVLRYWGVASARPEDFTGSLTPDGTGITTGELKRLAEARGFQAFAFRGERVELVSHLEKGRPLIALLETAAGRHHYVVVLAWTNGRILMHDPATGPFRIVAENEWRRLSEPTGSWSLLLLPPADLVRPADPVAEAASSPADPCRALTKPGVDLALAGQLDLAREQLSAVSAWCPESSAPPREMAALELRAERWPAAAARAAEAVRRDPSDRFAWKLLATSRFVSGRREEALAAWNRVGEPRLGLVQIEGLERTPERAVHEYLGEEAGTLLTPPRLRRSKRRLEALPAAQLSSVSYRPLPGGTAELDVNVVERPAVSAPVFLALQSSLRALSERALGLEAFFLAPSGDFVRLSGQWRHARSRGALSASAPRFLGLPGIVTAEAQWDEQSYRLAPAALEDAAVRERRKRASLSLSQWWAADTRAAVTAAVDEWSGRGRYLSLSVDLEQRLLRDHLALWGTTAGWWLGASGPLYSASGRLTLRSATTPDRLGVRVHAGYDLVSADAPLVLWPGAGTGPGRDLLLRAHPLLHGGVLDGSAFGRALWSGGADAEAPLGAVGPSRLRAAAFVDLAKVVAPHPSPLVVDVGAGLRLQPPGWKSALRVDVATPWRSVRPTLSVGWQTEWR